MFRLSKKSNSIVSLNNKNEYRFKKSVFFPWTKVEMSLDKKQLLVTDQKTLFWTIPIGRKNQKTYPLQHISMASAQYRFSLNTFVVGIVLLYAYIYLVSYAFVLDIIVGFVSIFIFSLLLTSGLYCVSKGLSYKLYLIDKKEDKYTSIDISLQEKEKIQEFADKVNKAIKKH
jgi:hypothetical protein